VTDTLFPPDRKGAPTAEEIQTAREELRRRLPQLRKIPGFPNGTDEDILQMSLPPYYTACPNPFINDWLKATEPGGYGDEPYEDPGPYASDISVGKSHPIYKAHSYPTKVPHQAIMRYILHYTRPGDVVLDGFCGTGMTGVAAHACGKPEKKIKEGIEAEFTKYGRKPRWGARRAILQDLSPSATFIAAGLNLPIDADAFDKASTEILERFEAEWGWMYETTHIDGKTKAKIDYTVWSEVFTCPHCGGEVVFYDAAFDEHTEKVKDGFLCPNCGAGVSKTDLERRKVPVRTLAGDTIERVELRPVKIHYRIGKTKHSKDPDDADFAILHKIRSVTAPRFPMDELPHMHMTHERNNLPAIGITCAHHFFVDRALASLALLFDLAGKEEDPLTRLALHFWIEQAVWGLSRMNRYRPDGFSQVSQYQSGVYYVPALHSECAVGYNLGGKRASLVEVWAARPAPGAGAMIAAASSTQIQVPDNVIDYVFVDPPFGENIYYADLGYLIEMWHGVIEESTEEAIVDRNHQRPKALPDYQEAMENCFREFNRALKPGRWMTVEFNNSRNQVWLAIQEALSVAGFVVADTRIFDKEHLSYRQVTAKNAVKRDLIISAYKPADELEERFSIVAGTPDGAWEFVREHLAHIPVADEGDTGAKVVRERQADRLYDRMVAYHIHRSAMVPVTAAEFYAGLDERFPLRDSMYFLPEQAEAYERLRRNQPRQEELFITSEPSAVLWLRQLLRDRPATFAEVQPAFFDELQEGLADWEKLPDLRTLLEENFLQDDRDRWYVPDPTKASDLERLRLRGLLREFEAYTQGRGTLEKFRSEAVRAGFRDAWAARDFGLIVKVGERLPEDVFTDDPQLLYYYDNAKRLRG
jgi:DNA modification methylase